MNKLLQLLVLLSFAISSQAQLVCTPEPFQTEYFPTPSYNVIDTMYNGVSYEDVLTVHAPDSIVIAGILYVLDSIRIDSITGFPAGISYDCDQPNCVFVSPTVGCMKLFGTPNDTIGVYDLKIHHCLFFKNIPVTVCTVTPDSSGGGYLYRLGNTPVTAIEKINRVNSVLTCSPNPVVDKALFQYYPNQSGLARFKVSNTQGQTIYQEQVQTTSKQPLQLKMMTEDLPHGIYFCTMTLNGEVTSSKFVK